MRWIDYLVRFDFDIRYIKGTLNKVADVLSRYYEHDYWTNMPEVHDYVNADVRLVKISSYSPPPHRERGCNY